MPAKGCDIAKGIVEGQTFAAPAGGKGGSMTLSDLENYQPAVRVPIEGSYRGYRIKAMSPPSSGGLALIQMLKMLERFPLGDASQGFGFGSLKTVNVMADAMRIAFADRSAGWATPTSCRCRPRACWTRPTSACAVRRSCRARASTPDPLPGDPRPYQTAGLETGTRLAVAEPVTGPGETTTHFVVVDQLGQHGLVHQHHRVVARHRRVRRLPQSGRFVQEPRLPAEQRADRLQHRAVDPPVHRQCRLQRRAARTSARAAA